MHNKTVVFSILIAFILASCSSKNQLLYLGDYDRYSQKNIEHSSVLGSKYSFGIQAGDILKIDVISVIPEAAAIYNKSHKGIQNSVNLQAMILDGYRVNDSCQISYPVLGEIDVKNLSLQELEKQISNLLIEGGHLKNPAVKVSRLNFKFTVIGEVKSPGTFSTLDENINFFQALGHAGDLTINGKRKDIILLREEKGMQKIYNVNLTKSDIIKKPYFHIKNNNGLTQLQQYLRYAQH